MQRLEHAVGKNIVVKNIGRMSGVFGIPNIQKLVSRYASLTVMPEGEHWFHTEEQMAFLDNWILESSRKDES